MFQIIGIKIDLWSTKDSSYSVHFLNDIFTREIVEPVRLFNLFWIDFFVSINIVFCNFDPNLSWNLFKEPLFYVTRWFLRCCLLQHKRFLLDFCPASTPVQPEQRQSRSQRRPRYYWRCCFQSQPRCRIGCCSGTTHSWWLAWWPEFATKMSLILGNRSTKTSWKLSYESVDKK